MFPVPHLLLRQFISDKNIATFLLVLFNILFLPIERDAFSLVKIGMMALCPLIWILNNPFVTKALLYGLVYWLLIYFLSLLKGEIRFSTIGFSGMYIGMFITYYNYVIKGVFALDYFQKILKWIIIIYGTTLIAQQFCLLIGLKNVPIINLQNQNFLDLTKLPSLTLEPSHSARILTVAMLGYLRCSEIFLMRKLNLKELFDTNNKWVTTMFLWSMLTMGSGTAFVGMAILSIYFITRKTAIYIIPIFIGVFLIEQTLELKQMVRAEALLKASMTGNTQIMQQAEGSGATRIIPIINLFTKTDLTKNETWIGKQSMEKDNLWWLNNDRSVIDQYGLIAFMVSLLFVYSCMIRHCFSIETLIYIFLLGFSIGNIYYSWGCLMIFASIRYFQVQQEQGNVI